MILTNILLYILFFIIGTIFGSFCTLAMYRIPLGKDIIHTRSNCPNCNHKLSFFDMLPIISYIFLGGKCRYCHRNIKIRYLLIELFSGIVFTLFAISVKFNIYSSNISVISYIIVGFLYLPGLFIIAGIDKEKKQIRNEVLLYLIIVETIYIIYLYFVEHYVAYGSVVYLFIIVILVVINNIYLSKKAENNYTLQSLILIFVIAIFSYEVCTILTIISTIIAMIIYSIIVKVDNKKSTVNKSKEKLTIPVGFYICISNIIMIISTNMVIFKVI